MREIILAKSEKDRKVGKSVLIKYSKENNKTVVWLYNTAIAQIEWSKNIVTVRSEYWKTASTKENINNVLYILGAEERIYQHKKEWFIQTGNGNVPFNEHGSVITF